MSLEQLLAELRESYVASLPQKIEKIEQLWSARELKLLETEYHKLKGTGRTYGLPEISQLGGVMEQICETAPELLTNAVPLSLQLLAWIRRQRDDGQPPTIDSHADFQALRDILAAAGANSKSKS